MDFHAFLQRQGRPSIAVTRFQLLPRKGKADVPIDELQQVSLWILIFQAEAIEQRFGGSCCRIMISRPPTMKIHTARAGSLSSNMFCSISSR